MTDPSPGPNHGRAEQLQQLVDLLPGAQAAPRTALLAGEPGSGRGALVGQLKDQARDRLFLRWRFVSVDDGVASLLRLTAGCAGALSQGGEVAREAVSRLRTGLAEDDDERRSAWIGAFLDSIEGAQRTEEGGIQLQLPRDNPYWGLMEFLLALAGTVPVVLEMQQINAVTSPAFWIWFATLRREIARRELPVLWIFSTIDSPFGEQSDDPLPTPSGLLHAALTGAVDATVPLPPLEAGDVASLMEERYQPNRFPEELPGVLVAQTGGNLAHLEDLLNLLEGEEIVVWDEAEGFQLDGPLERVHLDELVPDAVPEPGDQDDGEMDPEARAALARSVLEVAALEGAVFTAGVIADTLGVERDTVDDLLDALPLLVEEARFQQAVQSWTYRFLRPVYREHFLSRPGSGPSPQARKMARALLDRYVPASSAYIPLAASLFGEIGQERQARNLLALAMGTDRLDLSRAAQEVVGLRGREDLPENLLRLLYAEPAERAVNGANAQLAGELIGALERWADDSGDASLTGYGKLLRSRLAMRERDLPAAVGHAEAALESFGDDPVRRGETLNQLAMLAIHQRDPKAARRYVEQAGKASTIPPVKATSLFVRGILRRGERKASGAAESFGEAARLAMTAGNPLLSLEARLNQGEMMMVAGRGKTALDPLRQARELATAMRVKPLERSATTLLAQAEAANGDPKEAFDLARDALALGQELNMTAYLAADHYHCGVFGLAAGDTAAGRVHLDASVKALGDGDSPLAKEVFFHLGQLQLVEGTLGDARESLTRSREVAQAVNDPTRAARALQALGMVEEKSGEIDRAKELYREAMEEMTSPALQKEREAIRRHLGEIEGGS